MHLCSEGHEEVCYEGRECPACEVKTDFEAKIKDLNYEIKDLTKHNDQLNDEIKQMRE